MRSEKRVKAMAALAGVMALLLVAATPLGHPALRLKASPSTVWDDSDPTVLVEGTHTYLFGSSNNRKVPVRQITSFSSSLATSQAYWAAHSADAMPTRPAWVNPAKWQIWAPSVVKIGSPVPDVLRVAQRGRHHRHEQRPVHRPSGLEQPDGPLPALGRAALLRPPR